jgi:hypothetical protein
MNLSVYVEAEAQENKLQRDARHWYKKCLTDENVLYVATQENHFFVLPIQENHLNNHICSPNLFYEMSIVTTPQFKLRQSEQHMKMLDPTNSI